MIPIIEIMKLILNQLDFLSQKNYRLTSKDNAINYPITNLYNNVPKLTKLNDNILKTYLHIIKLNAGNNSKITDVNNLIYLQILIATNKCGIDNAGISKLRNLTKLSIRGNKKITNINHLTKLQMLDASGKCKISDISKLTNLIELSIVNNNKITSISNLYSLQRLFANNAINDSNFFQLTNLTILSIDGDKIKNINYLTQLQCLCIEEDCEITGDGFSQLTNLTTLHIRAYDYVEKIDRFINLESLTINNMIENSDLLQLTKLTSLIATNNYCIHNINNLTNIRGLSIRGCHNINYNGLSCLTNLNSLETDYNKQLIGNFPNLHTLNICGGFNKVKNNTITKFTNLTSLNVTNNRNITDINSLTNLKILYALTMSMLDDNGISKLTNLTELHSKGNDKITRKI